MHFGGRNNSARRTYNFLIANIILKVIKRIVYLVLKSISLLVTLENWRES